MRKKNRYNEIFMTILSLAVPIAGLVFMLWYVKAAAQDVVYSDYIRIVAEYLPDVGDINRLLVPDILTRIPATFLARFINVGTFGYSVTFDRFLSLAGMALMAGVLALYFYKYDIPLIKQLPIYIVLFSLNKWEILLNGTAWAHVMSFGLFFICYFLMDRLWRGETNAKEELLICLMPLFFLLIAGEYIVSYCVTVMLISIFGVLLGGGVGVSDHTNQRGASLFKLLTFTSALALALYAVSRHFAVWEHTGATEMSFAEAFKMEPMYFPRFFFNTFAGAVVGQETIQNFFGDGIALPALAVTGLGVIIFIAYVISFIIFIRLEIFEKTIFPLILLISGFGNHVLVTMGRWIFMNDSYGLSSRYAGQFMVGLIGMLIIFALYGRQKRPLRGLNSGERAALRICSVAAAVLIMAGNCYTTYQEIVKAKYREENYAHMAEVIKDYESYTEDELKAELEWTKDAETLYTALGILKDNELNVFR